MGPHCRRARKLRQIRIRDEMSYRDLEKRRAWDRERYMKNRETRLAAVQEYRARPEVREKIRVVKARYYAENKSEALSRLARRRAFVARWKIAAGCARCGFAEHSAALDLDHFADNKTAEVSRLLSGSWSKLVAEIWKCVVLCSNCHRIVTFERRGE